jgi:hypothetical protein
LNSILAGRGASSAKRMALGIRMPRESRGKGEMDIGRWRVPKK